MRFLLSWTCSYDKYMYFNLYLFIFWHLVAMVNKHLKKSENGGRKEEIGDRWEEQREKEGEAKANKREKNVKGKAEEEEESLR